MKTYTESNSGPYVELRTSEHGTYTIFDLPPSKMHATEGIIASLRERAFMVRFLQGEDRPADMIAPYGVWPHPDAESIEMMRQAAEMPVYTSEEIAALGDIALRAA
jgi:hypothetical protein